MSVCLMDGVAAALNFFVSQVKDSNEIHYSCLKVRRILKPY